MNVPRAPSNERSLFLIDIVASFVDAAAPPRSCLQPAERLVVVVVVMLEVEVAPGRSSRLRRRSTRGVLVP